MVENLQSLLGSITIALGGAAGLLAVLDWILSKKSKDWIKDKTGTIWIWLSYQQSWPYIRKLQNPRAFDLFAAVGTILVATISFVLIVRSDLNAVSKAATCVIVLIPVAAIYFMRGRLRRAVAWLSKDEAGWKILIRSALTYFATVVVAGTLIKIFELLYIAFPTNPFAIFPVAVIAAIVTFVVLMLLYALLLCIFYIVGIYLMIFLFKVSEFTVLRIAEYDKGPVLGLAALLTGVGAILKALAS